MTTNHCVDVLLELLCSNFDWHQSCKRGVPLRKLKIRKPKKDESTEFNEINEDDFSVDSSNETQEIHAHRTKTCLAFGIENVDVEFLRALFMKAWSILIVGSSQDTLKKAIADIKNGNKEGGEIGFGIVDFVSEGDNIRLKDIVNNRFQKQLDLLILGTNEVGDPSRNLLTKTLPVREFIRGKKHFPKILLITESEDKSLNEWIKDLTSRCGSSNIFQTDFKKRTTDILTWVLEN